MTTTDRYVDAEASGANDGTSEADAWTSLTTARNETNSFTASMSSGDLFRLHIKDSATLAATTTALAWNLTHPQGSFVVICGYTTTVRDGVESIDNAARYGAYLDINTQNGGGSALVAGLDVTNSAATSGGALSGGGVTLYRCRGVNSYRSCGIDVFDGDIVECYGEVDSAAATANHDRGGLKVARGSIINSVAVAGIGVDAGFRGNFIRGNLILPKATGSDIASRRGIFVQNTESNPALAIEGNTIYGMPGSGIYIEEVVEGRGESRVVTGNLIYGCGGYAVENGDALSVGGYGGVTYARNLHGSNTSGWATSNISAPFPSGEYGNDPLTADPFTDAASGDFSLNDAAGGGAVVRAAAAGDYFGSGTNPNRLVGYWQRAGGSVVAPTTYRGRRR